MPRFPRKGSARPGKGCLVGFGLFWIVFSSVFVAVGVSIAWKSAEHDGRERVPCVIERFEIDAERSRNPPFVPDLLFRYEYGGESRTGTKLWPEKEGDDDYAVIAEVRESLSRGPEGPLASPEGVRTECLVSPDDPADAALVVDKTDRWFGLVFAVFGLCFSFVGVAIVGSGVRAMRRREAVSETGSERSGGLAGVAFAVIFLVAGLAVLFGVVVPKGAEYLAVRGWRETPATVIWSEVAAVRGDDGTTYKVDLFYRYDFEGREHRSNRYNIPGGSSSGREAKEAVVRAHPPGSSLTVYVNPEKPWQAVANRDLGWWCLFALFPVPFIAVGGGMLLWMRKERRGKLREADGFRVPIEGRLEGARVLRSGGKRGCGFAVTLFAAVFWNGIVSVFAVQVLESWRKGDPQWGLTLFLIPFLLVGVGLALLALYSFLAIFAPSFVVELEESDLFPGRETRLHWRRSGGFGLPRDFTLYLVGREEATYRRGTSTSTATSVFHEEVVFHSEHPHEMRSGSAVLRIPADAPPDFKGGNNRIRWFLRIRAVVPRMPDVGDDHELSVRPFQRHELP